MRQRPFPKYIAMGGVMTAVIGYLGGGPVLSFVWGLCGAGFGPRAQLYAFVYIVYVLFTILQIVQLYVYILPILVVYHLALYIYICTSFAQ